MGYSLMPSIPSPSSATRSGEPTVSRQMNERAVGRQRAEVPAHQRAHPLHERLLRAGEDEQHHATPAGGAAASPCASAEQRGDAGRVVVRAGDGRAQADVDHRRHVAAPSRRAEAPQPRRSAEQRPERRPAPGRPTAPHIVGGVVFASPSSSGGAERPRAGALGGRPARSARRRGARRARPCARRPRGRLAVDVDGRRAAAAAGAGAAGRPDVVRAAAAPSAPATVPSQRRPLSPAERRRRGGEADRPPVGAVDALALAVRPVPEALEDRRDPLARGALAGAPPPSRVSAASHSTCSRSCASLSRSLGIRAAGYRRPQWRCPSTSTASRSACCTPPRAPPARTRPGDAGYDLRAVEPFALAPGERGGGADRRGDRAPARRRRASSCRAPGSPRATGSRCVNGPGLIDPNYRGELRVVLVNLGAEPFAAQPGDRIAQLLLVPYWAPELARRRRAAAVGATTAASPASAPPAASRAPLPSTA